MKPLSLLLVAGLLTGVPSFAQHVHHADAERQSEVARRGVDVMPFDLAATTHVFTKTKDGGIQKVFARDRTDAAQVGLVREHLRAIQIQFRKGDFSGPAHIHGDDMPGLAELESAPAGTLAIDYRDTKDGAQLIYTTKDPKLVAALHNWFDAQLSDHGADAMAGHQAHHHQ